MKTYQIAQRLVLGSSSVYRRELLQRLQIPFEIYSPDIEETPLAGERPNDAAVRLPSQRAKQSPILSGRINHRCRSSGGTRRRSARQTAEQANATRQLQLVGGKEVVFYTALSLFNSRTNGIQTRLVASRVKFRQLNDQQINNYLDREQPYHCAGSAKAEGLGIALIECVVSDDPSALIGLPLIALVDMLAHEGIEVV